jgi:MFS family permease
VGVFDGERRALTVGILLAVGAFAVEGMGVVPALPTAVKELGGLGLFGWAFSAFMLAWIVGTIGGGLIADARGPRLPMGLGLLGFAVGLLVAGSAREMVQFLSGRALQGLGGGAMVSAAYVAIARGYPDEMRARMMALTASVWILPAVVGPAASGAVAQWVGWRWVFVGIVPVIAFTALVVLPPLGRFQVKQSVAGTARMVAAIRVAVGAALVLAAENAYRWASTAAAQTSAAASHTADQTAAHAAAPAAAVTDAAVQAASAGLVMDAAVQAGAVADAAVQAAAMAQPVVDAHGAVAVGVQYGAIAAAAGFVIVGLVLAVPALRALLPRGTFVARRGLPAGLAVRGLLAFSYFGTEAFVPLGAGELRGATPTQAGLALTAGALGWISASWAQDRMETSGGAAGRIARVRLGLALLAVGIAVVAAALLTSLPFSLVPVGWAIGGAGIGLAYSAGGLICIAAAPQGQEGEVSGQLQLAEALSTAAGAGLGGVMLATLGRLGQTPRQAHAAVFAVTVFAALLGALLSSRHQSAAAMRAA